jgi:hypothetical protein
LIWNRANNHSYKLITTKPIAWWLKKLAMRTHRLTPPFNNFLALLGLALCHRVNAVPAQLCFAQVINFYAPNRSVNDEYHGLGTGVLFTPRATMSAQYFAVVVGTGLPGRAMKESCGTPGHKASIDNHAVRSRVHVAC